MDLLALLPFILLLTSLSSFKGINAKKDHHCQRECNGGPSRRCLYNFTVDFYYTMSKACYDCPHNLTDCDRPHCIPVDGVERGVIVINRQLPGPSIQVCAGDEIIVDVKNLLPGESCSIHWHGLHMVGTPYMDGVPMVTQCPVSTGAIFRYKFRAENPGTHFYHSHTGLQRADGFAGSLIVRQHRQRDPHSSQYDYDLPEHVIFLSDWLHELAVEKYLSFAHDGGDDIPSNLIVNGRGRLSKPRNQLKPEEKMPLSSFHVEKGRRYRFRLISNGILDCPIQVSIDNHTLLIIASDGGSLQPTEVDSLVIYAGERYDFVLNANQAVSSYWIRFRGLMDWNPKTLFQAAVLRYNDSPDREPEEVLSYNKTDRDGKILNVYNMGYNLNSTNQQFVFVTDLKAVKDGKNDWMATPDQRFYLAFDFYLFNNWRFNHADFYPVNGVEGMHNFQLTRINHINLMMPASPLLSQYNTVDPQTFCNDSTVLNCKKDYCECTHTIRIPLGSLIELILIDKGVTFDISHPFHLHGTDFRVVSMQRVASSVTVKQIKKMDEDGLIRRNLVDAPIKDTVTVPDGGYTIIRFVANNPGYWLFHCHLAFHMEMGMGLIFKIGEHGDFPAVPKNFPTCGNFIPPINEEPIQSHAHLSSGSRRLSTHQPPSTGGSKRSASGLQFLPFAFLFTLVDITVAYFCAL